MKGSKPQQRTPWFDAVSVDPRHSGWYEVSWPLGERCLYLVGLGWFEHVSDTSPSLVFPWPGDKWRGLANKP
jgi:hypothetical protein